jgi:Ca-activated chloride channel family protein
LTNKALVEDLLKQKNKPPAPEPDREEPQATQQQTPPGVASQTSDSDEPQTPEPQTGADKAPSTSPPKPGANEVPGSELGDEQHTTPPLRPATDSIEGEQQQALEQWLRQIPDDPGELLRRKFWYEQQQHQDQEDTR